MDSVYPEDRAEDALYNWTDWQFDLTADLADAEERPAASGSGGGSVAPHVSAHDDGWNLVVECPWCGQTHHHGRANGSPSAFSHRVAHCLDREAGNPGYVLQPERGWQPNLPDRESTFDVTGFVSMLDRILMGPEYTGE